MADWILAAFAIAGATIYFGAALSLEKLEVGDALGPQAFPVIVAACMFLSGLLLAWETWRKQTSPADPARRAPQHEIAAAAPGEDRRHQIVLVAMVAWTALYYVAFEPVGYLVSTMTYLSAMLLYFHRVNPLINLAYAAAFTAFAYLLFTGFLHVVLPSGIAPF